MGSKKTIVTVGQGFYMTQQSKNGGTVLKKAINNKAVGLLEKAKTPPQRADPKLLASQKEAPYRERDPLWFLPIPVWITTALLLLKAWWVGVLVSYKSWAFVLFFFFGWTYSLFPDILCYFQEAFRYLAGLYQRSPPSVRLLCCCGFGFFAGCIIVFLLKA